MDIGVILFIAVICLVIGFALSRLLTTLQEDIDEDPSSLEESSEILKVWHEDKSGKLKVDFNNRPYEQAIELSSKDRYKFQQILLQLNTWFGPETSSNLEASNEVSEVDSSEEEETRVSYNPLLMLRDAIKADVPKIPLQDVNIVAQIDEILQERLQKAGYENAATRMMDLPGQGMVVMIGLEKYIEIEDIPDHEIRTLIHESVREWEKQQDIEYEKKSKQSLEE